MTCRSTGPHCSCSPAKSCARCQRLRKSFSSVDARHTLKLCEMSRVVLRLLMGEFLQQRRAEPVAVSYQSDAIPEVTVETLVSLLQGRRVLWQSHRQCKYLPRAFDRVRHEGWSNNFVRLPCTYHRKKRHGPTCLLHAIRSCIPSRSVTDV